MGSRVTISIVDTDRGMEKIHGSISALGAKAVHAGSVGKGSDASTPAFVDRRSGAPLPDGETVAAVLSWHEFGAGVPKRSVLVREFDSTANAAGDAVSTSVDKMIAARSDEQVVFDAAGEFYAEKFRDVITTAKLLPLAESTKADPGRDPRHIPLWDTGQIVDSLGHKAVAP